MKNPFQQFIPEDPDLQSDRKEEVMGNIHTKSFLLQILEFFTAIFGVTLRESLPPDMPNPQNSPNSH